MERSRAGRVFELIASLPYPAAERNWLLMQLNRIDPSHQVRSILLQGNDDNIGDAFGEDALLELQRFMRAFGPIKGFGWVPALDYFLLNARLAAFWSPESYVEGTRAEARAWFSAFSNNPISLVFRTGMLETMSDILDFQCASMGRFYNFGDCYSETLSPTHMTLHFDRCYAPIFAPMAAGVVDGIFELAKLECELNVIIDEEYGHGTLDVCW